MNEKKLVLSGPIFLFALLFIFFYGMFIKNLPTALIALGISFFYSMTIWFSTLQIIYLSRKKHPGIFNTRIRLRFLIFLLTPLLLLLSLIDQLFSLGIGLYKALRWEDYIFITGLNILCSIIIVAVFEGFYYIRNWQLLFAESEKIKKINLSNQFQLLKEQVKPHFLFNSLNTLISLIPEKPDNAIRFTEELSSVYRYLLRKNLRELSTVREELEFIRLYTSMMQTRFADSLSVSIDIGLEVEDTLLPPFVLQLLVENAIKHNIVSTAQPLVISIFSRDEYIIVSNNLQRKRVSEKSEKTGLLNLIERYKLLNKEHLLQIREEDGLFEVVLPLIYSEEVPLSFSALGDREPSLSELL